MSFLTVEPYLAARFDMLARQHGVRAQTAGELLAWQQGLRTRLRSLIGLDTMQECALEPQAGPIEALDGYTSQRVVIQVEPGLSMPVVVLVPASLKPGERRAVVLAPHGHGGGGKASIIGRREQPAIEQAIARYRYDYGVQLVQHGFVVLCPDARGFGERRERPYQSDEAILNSSCREINNMAMPLGQTLTGMWTWDLMRLIDYAATRDDCDISRLGCAGLSGGGLQTLWLAALDQRVGCAVISGYFYGYKESLLHMHSNCSCNYVPGLWQLVDMGDIGGLIAPRPLLIESGTRDPLNGAPGITNVVSQLDIARSAYRLLNADKAIAHTTFEGEHRWDGADTPGWLKRWLV